MQVCKYASMQVCAYASMQSTRVCVGPEYVYVRVIHALRWLRRVVRREKSCNGRSSRTRRWGTGCNMRRLPRPCWLRCAIVRSLLTCSHRSPVIVHQCAIVRSLLTCSHRSPVIAHQCAIVRLSSQGGPALNRCRCRRRMIHD